MSPRPGSAYAWILFDADGTLFDYDAAETAALRESFAGIGRTLEPGHAEIYRRINGEMWRDFEIGATTQQRLRVERFERLFDVIGFESDARQFADDYLANLARRTELIDGADETVAALAESSSLMLITNGIAEVQRRRFAASPIRRHFADIVISEEVGAAKPDRRIFDSAFARMGNPPKPDVLIVGDSLTSDIAGGIEYGIDSCWFNPSGLQAHDGVEPSYEIRHLDQLLDILDSI